MEEELVSVGSASGALEGEILRGMLEAHGVQVWLSTEAAASIYGLGVGPLAEVHLLVRPKDVEAAREILEEYYSGDLDLED
jgi:hypothetical protein